MRSSAKVMALVLVMGSIAATVTVVSVCVLYRTALEHQRERLRETVESHARLLEAVYEHERSFAGRADQTVGHGDPAEALLQEVQHAHERFHGFGETGEFTIARREGDQIVFLIAHRHAMLAPPPPVPFAGDLAAPQRRALSDQAGTMVGLDYRGVTVLAAHRRVEGLDWGLVAKIDMAEIRAPFIRAAALCGLIAAVLVCLGTFVFLRIANPMVRELERRERRYRTLFETMTCAVVGLGADRRVVELNGAAERLLGRSRAEILGRDYLEVFVPEAERPAFTQTLQQVTFRAHVEPRESSLRAADGTEHTVLWCLAPLGDDSDLTPGVLAVGQDVTVRAKLEAQFLQSQKMESIGRLAGGVAHDFNNLLTAILGNVEFLLQDMPPDDPRRADLDQIQEAGQRAADLTRQLLAFSRRQVMDLRTLDLNEIVTHFEKMLRRLIGEDVELVTVLAKGLAPVRADRGHLEQVLMNLAINGRDAMLEGGKLTIATGNCHLDQAYCAAHADVRAGRYVQLAVSDDGCGMDQATRARLFEPFFTTKAHGKGTGLGLATVYGIVKQSGGHIDVHSEPGRGTTFTIYLPVVEGRPELIESSPKVELPARGSETVLVVEDEPPLRELMQRALAAFGYRTLEAGCGAEALALAEKCPDVIHLLVTDVIMPGMTGNQLAERLVTLRPGLAVLYVSGYTDDAIVHQGSLDPDTPFLQKPFTPAALARKVHEVLVASRRPAKPSAAGPARA